MLPNATASYWAFANGSKPGGSAFSAANNCLFNVPGNEGQERTISGPGCRPLVNALMFSEALSLSRLCSSTGNATCTELFEKEANTWRERTLSLWNPGLAFFDTLNLPGGVNVTGGNFSGVREIGSLSSPWYFGAVPPESAGVYGASWGAAFDSNGGLLGPFGLRSAEARHPKYKCPLPGCSGGCYWSGPVWPFETSKVLMAQIYILQQQTVAASVPQVNRSGWWMLLDQFTRMHTAGQWVITNYSKEAPDAIADAKTLQQEGLLFDGLDTAWLAELGCAENATWTDTPEKGYKYLHSSFIDIVISGVGGLMPSASSTPPVLTVFPLQPNDEILPWWCIDGLLIGGRNVTVLWDSLGTRYMKGPGLWVLLEGNTAAHSQTLLNAPLVVPL